MTIRQRNILSVPFQTKTGTRNDTISEVMADRTEGVLFEHVPKIGDFFLCFFTVDLCDEFDTLTEGHISPVGPIFVVEIIGMKQGVKHVDFILAHIVPDIEICGSSMFARHIGTMRCSDAIVPERGRVSVGSSHVAKSNDLLWKVLVGNYGKAMLVTTGRSCNLYVLNWLSKVRV